MVVQGKAAGKLPLARIWSTVMSSARLSKTSSCRLDIDGAHQQAHWTFSEAAEINILLQQSSGRREVVQARPVPWKLVQRQLPVRQEETRRAEQDVPP